MKAAHLNVTFVPRAGTTATPQTFLLDLRKVGSRRLVRAWQTMQRISPRSGK